MELVDPKVFDLIANQKKDLEREAMPQIDGLHVCMYAYENISIYIYMYACMHVCMWTTFNLSNCPGIPYSVRTCLDG